MNLHITKNIQFTRLVKANYHLKEFNFRRITGAAEETFHVDVNDDRGNRLMFKMKKDQGGHWRIVQQPLPQWVYESEAKLHDQIEEELASV
jgi:uridine kinase